MATFVQCVATQENQQCVREAGHPADGVTGAIDPGQHVDGYGRTWPIVNCTPDESHCDHWWDGDACCRCAASPMTEDQKREQGMIDDGRD